MTKEWQRNAKCKQEHCKQRIMCLLYVTWIIMVYWLEIGTCSVDILFINFYVTKSAPDVSNIF